jgi:transposase
MINVPAGTRILLATRPIYFRKGAHSLAALAQEVLTEDPFSGAVIVYRAKCSDRLKILVWDTSGLVLVWKQLQQGSFRWPPIIDGVMKLSPVEFAAARNHLIKWFVDSTLPLQLISAPSSLGLHSHSGVCAV